eukprot:1223778-Pyramimonas_sp.AAC.1
MGLIALGRLLKGKVEKGAGLKQNIYLARRRSARICTVKYVDDGRLWRGRAEEGSEELLCTNRFRTDSSRSASDGHLETSMFVEVRVVLEGGSGV